MHDIIIGLRRRSAAAQLLLTTALACLPLAAAGAQAPSVELKILVLTSFDKDGAEHVSTKAFRAGLDQALVPYEVIDISADHPPITRETLREGTRAKFQAVVLPSEAVVPEGTPGLKRHERDALTAFESEFKVREFVGSVSNPADVGLIYTTPCGSLDGETAFIERATEDPFLYLRGSLPLANGSWGCPADPAGAFTPLVKIGGKAILGVFAEQGREQLVLTAAMNEFQVQFKALFPGMLNWLTYGVHLGVERNYFAVHIDDVLLETGRWRTTGECPGDDPCATCEDKLLMTPGDVDLLLEWQRRHSLKLDIAYNGAGYDNAPICDAGAVAPQIALGNALFAETARSQTRWLSHTYSHAYLGCELGTEPDCDRENGQVVLSTREKIEEEIRKNLAFYDEKIKSSAYFSKGELITGGHSGLNEFTKPSDNDWMAIALSNTGVEWIGSDSSLMGEKKQRIVQSEQNPAPRPALTVPRYPMNIFFDVASKEDSMNQYNATHTGKANFVPVASFDEFSDRESDRILSLVLSNGPLPHYVHQANLTGEHVLYLVLDEFLDKYNEIYAASAGLLNFTTTAFGKEQRTRAGWDPKNPTVKAILQGGQLTFEGAAGQLVPVTLPGDTLVEVSSEPENGEPHLARYADSISGWHGSSSAIALPSSVKYPQ
jgi:hypothetical protein